MLLIVLCRTDDSFIQVLFLCCVIQVKPHNDAVNCTGGVNSDNSALLASIARTAHVSQVAAVNIHGSDLCASTLTLNIDENSEALRVASL